MATKAELVDQLSAGKTKAEIADLEAMSKADLEAMAGVGEETEAPAVGTTVPGGQYKVSGKMVDSEGNEIGKKKSA